MWQVLDVEDRLLRISLTCVIIISSSSRMGNTRLTTTVVFRGGGGGKFREPAENSRKGE